jgi:hypothetical protein
VFWTVKQSIRRSQWPCGLRRKYTVARLLGLRVRTRQGHECLLSVVCCQVEVSATGRSPVRRSPIECSVSEHDLKTSKMRMPRPIRPVQSWKENDVL